MAKKQINVATSTAVAEHVALSLCMHQILWIKELYKKLNFELSRATIYEDNHACISIAKENVTSKRTKHLNIKYHFIKDEIKKGTAILERWRVCIK